MTKKPKDIPVKVVQLPNLERAASLFRMSRLTLNKSQINATQEAVPSERAAGNVKSS
jgi:hypothetical protein